MEKNAVYFFNYILLFIWNKIEACYSNTKYFNIFFIFYVLYLVILHRRFQVLKSDWLRAMQYSTNARTHAKQFIIYFSMLTCNKQDMKLHIAQ